MTEEIVRELVDGVWVTRVANQGGAGGPVTAADIDSQAASNGEVLTADGTGGASWEPGGGSQPGISTTQTVTAANINARLTNASSAWIELTDIEPGDLPLWCMEYVAPTFDGDVAFQGNFKVFTAGAAAQDVDDDGEDFVGFIGTAFGWASATPGTYQVTQSFTQNNLCRINAGAAVYVGYSVNTPPTTGQSVLTLAASRPS